MIPTDLGYVEGYTPDDAVRAAMDIAPSKPVAKCKAWRWHRVPAVPAVNRQGSAQGPRHATATRQRSQAQAFRGEATVG